MSGETPKGSEGLVEKLREVETTSRTILRGQPINRDGAQAARRIEELEGAVSGIADDYMTSEAHHPGYVLIPTAKFEQLREAALKETRDAESR